MKWVTITALLLLAGFEALADLPPKNYPYTLLSANNDYYLRSIPYVLVGNMGRTYVYNNKTGQQLYTIDRYFADATFLSNDGQYIASVSYWAGHNIPVNDSIYGYAIDFYIKSEKIKSYKITDLVKDKSKLMYSVSHVRWKYEQDHRMRFDKNTGNWITPPEDSLKNMIERNNVYQSNDTLYVTTVEKKVLVFYMPTGKMLKKLKATKFFAAKGFPFHPVNDRKEKLPGFTSLPVSLPLFTDTKKDLSFLLADLLKYKPANDAYYCNIFVRLKLLLDRNTGDFEIKELMVWEKRKDQPDEKGNINFSDLESLKQKILSWLKNKKFETKDLPEWIEKWYMDKEYYFTFQ